MNYTESQKFAAVLAKYQGLELHSPFKRQPIGEHAAFAVQVFKDFGLVDDDVMEVELFEYCTELLDLYRDNPYHRVQHPVDMLQFAAITILKTGMINYIEDGDLFTTFTAVLSHDVAHPGFSQSFFKELAQATYHNKRTSFKSKHGQHACSFSEGLVLPYEWKHAEIGWNLLEKHNFQDRVTSERAFKIMIMFTELGKANQFFQSVDRAEWASKTTEEKKILLLSWVVMASDVSNVARTEYVADRWSRAVEEEFAREGILRYKFKLDSPLFFDQRKTKCASQKSAEFAKGHPHRLLNFMRLEGSFGEIFDQLEDNIDSWESQIPD